MAIAVGILIALISLIILLLPFFRSRWRTHTGGFIDWGDEATRQREAIYQNIGTLRQDYDMGNISTEEYRVQLDSYRRQAALTLRQGDRLRSRDEELEREIQSLASTGDGDLPSPTCPECGASTELDAQVCSNCGAQLTE